MDDDIQDGGDPAEAFDRLRAVIEGQDRELALSMERGRSIGQELAQSVSIGRDRDRGMSR